MTYGLFRSFPAVLILWIVFCSVTTPLFAESKAPGAFAMITLERTSCYGACPVYKVEVRADGVVKYDGKNDVAVKGPRMRKVSSSDIDFLREAVKRVHFSDLRDTYENTTDGCKEVWTDLPRIIILIKYGSSEKKVSYYTGCRGLSVLRRVEWLADTIDEISGTSRWVGPRMFGSK